MTVNFLWFWTKSCIVRADGIIINLVFGRENISEDILLDTCQNTAEQHSLSARFPVIGHRSKIHIIKQKFKQSMKVSQKTCVLRPYIVSLYGEADQQWFHGKRLWNCITLWNLEDGGDLFSETSVLTRATHRNFGLFWFFQECVGC
jgi:hypothetical protein